METTEPEPEPELVQVQLLIRWQLGRELVTGPATKKQYVFTTTNNVCGAEVDARDVPRMLTERAACCGHVYSTPRYHTPTQKEARRWYRL